MNSTNVFILAASLGCVLGAVAIRQGRAAEEPAKGKATVAATVREIETDGLKLAFPKTGPKNPIELKTAEDLKKQVSDADVLEKLQKQVDFAKEKLVVFSWAGSGQDKLTGGVEGEGEAASFVAAYKGGMTRDLRPHLKIFAVSQKLRVRVKAE